MRSRRKCRSANTPSSPLSAHLLSTSLAFLNVTGILDESLDLGDRSIIAHMHKGKVNDMKNVIMQEDLDSSFDLYWVSQAYVRQRLSLKQILSLLALRFLHEKTTNSFLGDSTLKLSASSFTNYLVFCNKNVLTLHCLSADLKNTLHRQFIKGQRAYKRNSYLY